MILSFSTLENYWFEVILDFKPETVTLNLIGEFDGTAMFTVTEQIRLLWSELSPRF